MLLLLLELACYETWPQVYIDSGQKRHKPSNNSTLACSNSLWPALATFKNKLNTCQY